MRSRRDHIVTKDEVYGYANEWLGSALRLEHVGTKCTTSTLLQVLLMAAGRVVSIFAAYRDLADAPSDQTIRNALPPPVGRQTIQPANGQGVYIVATHRVRIDVCIANDQVVPAGA